MVKLVLNVPAGFNAELFCNVASALVRDEAGDDRREYDYNLGDFISRHYVAGDKVFYFGDNKYIQPMDALIEEAQKTRAYVSYEVSTDWVDVAHLEALKKLQELCPEVEFHFENCGDGENEECPGDEEYFDNAYYDLFKHNGVKKDA